ncbi:hypothetical protein [Schlesneria sp. T3-172]|uniref:hypothetical protein n=1 Tax=Schlesneria sphaerica TaxID=3373610 RepID=UPI0037C9082E
MTRPQSVLGVFLLVVTVFSLTWQSTRAGDEDQAQTTTKSSAGLTEAELLERIDALELRVSQLECTETGVRQIENSASTAASVPRKLSETHSEPSPYQSQNTNGTSWSFRTLSHRGAARIVR